MNTPDPKIDNPAESTGVPPEQKAELAFDCGKAAAIDWLEASPLSV